MELKIIVQVKDINPNNKKNQRKEKAPNKVKRLTWVVSIGATSDKGVSALGKKKRVLAPIINNPCTRPSSNKITK